MPHKCSRSYIVARCTVHVFICVHVQKLLQTVINYDTMNQHSADNSNTKERKKIIKKKTYILTADSRITRSHHKLRMLNTASTEKYSRIQSALIFDNLLLYTNHLAS